MLRYTKLTGLNERRLFDPAKAEDVDELRYFVLNKKWKECCPFFIEYPWDDVLAMCKDKYIEHLFTAK